MKIHTSHVNLAAEHNYSQKKQITINHSFRFSNIMNRQIERQLLSQIRTQPHVKTGSDWVFQTRFKGSPAVELSQRFVAELEKLRQILQALVDHFNSGILKGVCMDTAGFGSFSIYRIHNPGFSIYETEVIQKTRISFQEQENTNFFADGMVKTKDGRSIDFSFQMEMEREYLYIDQFQRKQKGYVMIDPLIINLEAAAPQISEVRMDFDLNADGNLEKLPVPEPGSAYLSLDRNRDGMINDGSELFGPSTGNGFEELSLFDMDQNSWIDENDPIFDELTLWGGDNQGQMQLTRIKDAGLGAVYLANVPSKFDLKDDNNELTGRIKKSGIALNEDGSVHSVQEMDFPV